MLIKVFVRADDYMTFLVTDVLGEKRDSAHKTPHECQGTEEHRDHDTVCTGVSSRCRSTPQACHCLSLQYMLDKSMATKIACAINS